MSVELADGQKINGLSTPYAMAKKVKRKSGYPVLIVSVPGDDRLLAFVQE